MMMLTKLEVLMFGFYGNTSKNGTRHAIALRTQAVPPLPTATIHSSSLRISKENLVGIAEAY